MAATTGARILAIESATDWLSVAVLEGDRTIAEFAAAERMQHASAILPAVDLVLAETGLSLAEMEGVAVSTGPGAFTSLRIGIATVKGLCFGSEVPVIGVSTLEAMAFRAVLAARDAGIAPTPVLAVLDARRGEWYAGAWQQEGPDLAPVLEEGLYGPDALGAIFRDAVRVQSPHGGDWETVFAANPARAVFVDTSAAARPAAAFVGRLAAPRLARGEGAPAASLAARYVRRAEAEAVRLGEPVESGEVARVDGTREAGEVAAVREDGPTAGAKLASPEKVS